MTRIKKIAKLFLIICIYLSSCNVFSYEVLADSTVKFGNTSVVLDYGPGDYFTDDHSALDMPDIYSRKYLEKTVIQILEISIMFQVSVSRREI